MKKPDLQFMWAQETAGKLELRPTPPTPPTLYAPPRPRSRASIELRLDANEGPSPVVDVADVAARLGPEGARRYLAPVELERVLARRLGVRAEQVVATAGADEAIDRACRTFLRPSGQIIIPTPSFEMIGRYARSARADVTAVDWKRGDFPLEAILAAASERTAMVAVVSPNNPTGGVATASQIRALSAALPGAVLLVDVAYAEFADEDLTQAALSLPNAIVLRTFSKAYGLAGMRVGYAAGPEPLIQMMRGVGSPFPISALSEAAAREAIEAGDDVVRGVVERVRVERQALKELLTENGACADSSQGNFVLGEFRDAGWAWEALASLGIAVRRFGPGTGLDRFLRITCPGEAKQFERLSASLRAVLRPEAILFDMDGVIADVSGSYRASIVQTAAAFGGRVDAADIAAIKAAGNANNDWVVTQRLLVGRGIDVSIEDVKARFEAIYQGADGRPGLRESESLIPARSLLERLAARMPLAIVTGRPRRDCSQFLERFGLGELFRVWVCMEDAKLKPSAEPVQLAMKQLGLRSAWMVGDTPDDLVAARGAGVVPLGIAPPGENPEAIGDMLLNCGAARVLKDLTELEGMLV